MLVKFQIEYKTHIGQTMVIVGSIPELGNGNQGTAQFMSLTNQDTGLWEYEVKLDTAADFTYRYFVKDDNFNILLEEWGAERTFKADGRPHQKIILDDRWRSMSDAEYTLHSSAFLNAIFKPGKVIKAPKAENAKNTVILRFRPDVVRIKPGHTVAVSGNAKALGAWNEDKAIALGNADFPKWSGEVKVNLADFPVHYKYLIKNEDGKTEFWENCFDHIINLPESDKPDIIEINNEKFDFPRYPWKGTGVAIPVFSLRRQEGFGIGEFTDLKLLVDWSAEVGIRLIQILPVNDTVAKHTWTVLSVCRHFGLCAASYLY